MPRTPAGRKFHQAEAAVFADHGLEPQPRWLELNDPPTTLRALEVGLPAYRRLLASSLGRPAVGAASRDLLRATYLGTRRRGYARTVSTYLREQLRGVAAEPPLYELQDDELRRIRQPVLVLWGDRDDRFQPIASARQRAASLPRITFQLVPGGHEPWLESLEECAWLIAEFIVAGSPSRRKSNRRPDRAKT